MLQWYQAIAAFERRIAMAKRACLRVSEPSWLFSKSSRNKKTPAKTEITDATAATPKSIKRKIRRVGELCSWPSIATCPSIRLQKNHHTGDPTRINVTATNKVFVELVVETTSLGVKLSRTATRIIMSPAAAAIKLMPEIMYS